MFATGCCSLFAAVASSAAPTLVVSGVHDVAARVAAVHRVIKDSLVRMMCPSDEEGPASWPSRPIIAWRVDVEPMAIVVAA